MCVSSTTLMFVATLLPNLTGMKTSRAKLVPGDCDHLAPAAVVGRHAGDSWRGELDGSDVAAVTAAGVRNRGIVGQGESALVAALGGVLALVDDRARCGRLHRVGRSAVRSKSPKLRVLAIQVVAAPRLE